MNNNNLTNGDVPLGLGMAFAQNVEAMRCFSAMSDQERRSVIEKSRGVRSPQEMRAFVASLTKQKEN